MDNQTILIFTWFIFLQGTQLKDIKIPADAPKILLLEKHADYIAAYGDKKDDYVKLLLFISMIVFFF